MNRYLKMIKSSDKNLYFNIIYIGIFIMVLEVLSVLTPIIFIASLNSSGYIYLALSILFMLLYAIFIPYLKLKFTLLSELTVDAIKINKYSSTIDLSFYDVYVKNKKNLSNFIFSMNNQSLVLRFNNAILKFCSAIATSLALIINIILIDIRVALVSLIFILLTFVINFYERKMVSERSKKIRDINFGLDFFESEPFKSNFIFDNAIYNYTKFFLKKMYNYFINLFNGVKRIEINIGILKSLASVFSFFAIFSVPLTIRYLDIDLYMGINILFSNILIAKTVGDIIDSFSKVQLLKVQFNQNIFFEMDKTDTKSTILADGEFVNFKNISHSFDDKNQVLQGLDFSIKEGEIVAIVGENGSGKSTLINILTGVIIPSDGKLELGNDIKISVSNQIPILFPESIKDNVIMNRDYSFENYNQALLITQFNDVLKANCLNDDRCLMSEYNEDGISLSGGERVRLYIARNIYEFGDILIMDEPTASLDSELERDIFNNLLNVKNFKTKIFISHRLANCKKADRIIFLCDGKISEMGTHEELMIRKGEYYELFMKQQCLYAEGKLD
ncbi:MAG: ABC transporter ATP-binding protein/permease [Ezakiella sp.]|nr:ABC transporter ATP-binding protein/permease [Ezakiella sp.]MDD7472149.1 ABC transporter ATP-binding protein/permease [Bacillota bacterium]MDY3923484.1 ABC transporter ATP-binding protein/permease [Ezakiella sp.]